MLKDGGKSGRYEAKPMISVDEALNRVFALVAPLEAERVPLAEAAGRVLAGPVDGPPRPAALRRLGDGRLRDMRPRRRRRATASR